MSFWRKEVLEFALDRETRAHVEEQRAWIAREPANPQPYCNLSQLYRMEGKQEEALGLLLEAVRLDAGHGGAHLALAEIYAVRGDCPPGGACRLAARGGTAHPLRSAGMNHCMCWSHSAMASSASFRRRTVSGVCGFQVFQRVTFFWKSRRAEPK